MMTSVLAGRAPLVTETTASRSREDHKNLKKNWQTVQDRRVMHTDTKEPYWVGLSNNDTVSASCRHIPPIFAFGAYFKMKKRD
jgi:hypothetical protein